MAHLIAYGVADADAARVAVVAARLGIAVEEVSSVRALNKQVDNHSLVIAPASLMSKAALQRLRQRASDVMVLLIADLPANDGLAPAPSHVLDVLEPGWDESDLENCLAHWRIRHDTVDDPQRLSEIITLMELGRLLTGTLELDELYEQIIDQVQRAFDPDTLSLMLLEPSGTQLRIVAQRGLTTATGTAVAVAESIAGRVVREMRPQLLLGGLQGTSFERMARGGGTIASAMSIPLIVKNEVLGVLNVSRRPLRALYTENDANLLAVFALQIAIAIQNAQLYESLRNERDLIIRTQEMVRRELARDLHDGLGQVLATLAVNLNHLKGMIERGVLTPDQMLEDLTFLGTVARQAVQDARTLTFGLRPLVLETRGLGEALEQYLKIMRDGSRATTYYLDKQCIEIATLSPQVSRMVFAVLQEAVNNARKHAGATNIWITLGCDAEDGVPVRVRASVRDDGDGFKVPTTADEQRISFGLTNMRERIGLIGGRIRIESSPGNGTLIELEAPWRMAEP